MCEPPQWRSVRGLHGERAVVRIYVSESDRWRGRALYVAKHRGSACEESIWPYRIDGERGLVAVS